MPGQHVPDELVEGFQLTECDKEALSNICELKQYKKLKTCQRPEHILSQVRSL